MKQEEKTAIGMIKEAAGLEADAPATVAEIIRGLILKGHGAKYLFSEEIMALTGTDRPHDISRYIKAPDGMRADREKSKAGIKTCFHNLNEKTHGVRSDLYVIAAASGVGKTTFCLQLADHLAADGEDVIYFAMEQSAEELAAKSITRTIHENNRDSLTENEAVRDEARTPEIAGAEQAYCDAVGDRMNIVNIGLGCTCEFMEEYTEEYIRVTGKRPCVFIDYLQLIAPDSGFKGTTKEMMDETVKRFKQLSMRFNIPVFLISAVNRTSYYVPLSMDSLKESGGIEYTAAYIWGLQPAILKTHNHFKSPTDKNLPERRELIEDEKDTSKKKIRYMNLTSLKGRGINPTFDIYFNYYPAFDLFVDALPPVSSNGNQVKENSNKDYDESLKVLQQQSGKRKPTIRDKMILDKANGK